MRRKSNKPKPQQVETKDGAPTLAPRPPELKDALVSLQKLIGIDSLSYVATGYRDIGKTPGWCLYVFTVDPDLKLPSTHEGFVVERRVTPKPQPLWGKLAKG